VRLPDHCNVSLAVFQKAHRCLTKKRRKCDRSMCWIDLEKGRNPKQGDDVLLTAKCLGAGPFRTGSIPISAGGEKREKRRRTLLPRRESNSGDEGSKGSRGISLDGVQTKGKERNGVRQRGGGHERTEHIKPGGGTGNPKKLRKTRQTSRTGKGSQEDLNAPQRGETMTEKGGKESRKLWDSEP